MDRAARTTRRAAREMEQSAEQAGSSWTRASALMGAAFAGISAGTALTAFVQNTINAQNEQAQLAAVLVSTGRAATMSADSLNAMADAIESASTISAGEVTEAQTALLAFTGIAGQEFPRAMQAAADMAARTGMTIRASAETIGRALDIPSQGLAALSRQGFRFTEEQKALVEQLELSGRTAEAQGVVLRALEESYGGAAAAARDTLGGALIGLRNTVSALLTDENGSLTFLRDAVEGLNSALGSDAAKAGLNALTVAAGGVAAVIGAKLVAAVLSAGLSMTVFAARAVAASTGMAGVALTLEVAAARMAAMGTASRLATAGLAMVGGPLGVVALTLGAAGYAWLQYGRDARDSASAGAREVADTKRNVDDLVTSFKKLNELQRQQVISIKTDDLNAALKENQAAIFELGNAFTPALTEGARAAAQYRADFTAEMKAVASDTSLSSEQMAASLAALVESYVSSGRASESSRGRLIEFAQKVIEASGNVAGLRQEIEALTGAQAAAADGVAPVINELDKYRAAYDKFLKEFATPGERLKGAEKEWRAALGPLFDSDAQKRLNDRFLPKGSAQQASELQGLVKRLEEQRATLGMTADAQERYRIEQAKGSDAHRARAIALFDEIQAWKEAEEATKKAAESARYFDAVQREIDLYQRERDIEVAGVGMTDQQREQLEQEVAIRQKYAERRRKLEEDQQVESTRLDQSAYAARIEALRDAEDRQVAILQDSAARKREAESSWQLGMARGLGNYVDSALNVASSIEGAVTNAFTGMDDALTGFVRTGKLSFKDLADSIISDMVRIAIQQSITGPLAGALGGLLGSWMGSSSAVSGSSLQGIGGTAGGLLDSIQFSSGGYTGDGGRFEPAGIVHRGEGVLNQDEIRALGGASGFAALRRSIRTGHAVGGMAGSPALPPPAGRSRSGGALQVEIINNGTPQQVTGVNRRLDVSGEVISIVVNDLRRNGRSAQAVRGVMGG
ncbi:phage tail tape measure protein, lambda family [Bordetella bronchiseptica 980-2]|nr:phage tail tape measure protein, lambda family [Bordetella bronchiseptica 980-2]KCV59681.1 phage tail tape measure protein, lambda family [Bordetella bronchiseptica 980]KDB58476.1 phage tail tape measure protein, lambda family [Bordetella bronchiseptica A1-7]KDB74242.1 phage tail tape measure protein, lambda family [Bordetella bronchiseptica B20-10725633]KDB81061.1 phage tail tape measure protein, lambda family [Bordetella bronchiseptica D756]KDB92850.1 phage tail tape measure protein, lamb